MGRPRLLGGRADKLSSYQQLVKLGSADIKLCDSRVVTQIAPPVRRVCGPVRMEPGPSPRAREDKDRIIEQLRMELQAEKNKNKALHEDLRALREAQVQAVRERQTRSAYTEPASCNGARGGVDHKHVDEADERH